MIESVPLPFVIPLQAGSIENVTAGSWCLSRGGIPSNEAGVEAEIVANSSRESAGAGDDRRVIIGEVDSEWERGYEVAERRKPGRR